jgi:hypothetical protein
MAGRSILLGMRGRVAGDGSPKEPGPPIESAATSLFPREQKAQPAGGAECSGQTPWNASCNLCSLEGIGRMGSFEGLNRGAREP